MTCLLKKDSHCIFIGTQDGKVIYFRSGESNLLHLRYTIGRYRIFFKHIKSYKILGKSKGILGVLRICRSFIKMDIYLIFSEGPILNTWSYVRKS